MLGGAGGPTSTGTSPREALRHEEIASTGRFVALIFGMIVVLAASLPFLGGDPAAKRLFMTGLAVATAAGYWLHRLLQSPEHYEGVRAAVCWGLCAAGALTGVYYFGAFSSAPALLCLGIYFIALGQSRATAWLVYGMCAVFQAALAGSILSGALADPGMMVPAETITAREAAVTQVLVQACMAGAFLLGRTSRSAKLVALAELERAKQAVAAREGQLEEAREDLDRAMRIGDAGRYSERTFGSYRLGAVIGRGAMGDVYEAAHAETGEAAAVKLIQPERLDSPENRTRFLREIEIAASLESPNVVRVLEVSEPDAPMPYLAMERLVGKNLSHHLRARSRLGPHEVLTLARHVGAGLDAAARAGIIHRDIKPQNLFLHEPAGQPPVWKILDFGVSKLAGGSDTLTHGRLVGTPAYMAPEQAHGDEVDPRVDVYALGAILYRALTGYRPFRGKDVARTVYAVVYTMPPRPSEFATLPPEVDAVLAVALAKRRDDRFDTAGELAEALDVAVAGRIEPDLAARARSVMRQMPWGTRA